MEKNSLEAYDVWRFGEKTLGVMHREGEEVVDRANDGNGNVFIPEETRRR